MVKYRVYFTQHAAQCAALIGTLLIMPYGLASSANADKLYGTVGVCVPANSTTGKFISMTPNSSTEVAFGDKNFPLRQQDYSKFSDFINTGVTEVLQQPKYGTLREVSGGAVNPENNTFEYTPNAGYVGNDKAVFLVSFGDYRVKVIYFIKVIKTEISLRNIEGTYSKYCPRPSEWLISSNSFSTNDATRRP